MGALAGVACRLEACAREIPPAPLWERGGLPSHPAAVHHLVIQPLQFVLGEAVHEKSAITRSIGQSGRRLACLAPAMPIVSSPPDRPDRHRPNHIPIPPRLRLTPGQPRLPCWPPIALSGFEDRHCSAKIFDGKCITWRHECFKTYLRPARRAWSMSSPKTCGPWGQRLALAAVRLGGISLGPALLMMPVHMLPAPSAPAGE
jgi:hypothetical protein